MSAKAGGNHQGRRTPLSLTSGIPKLQSQTTQNQQRGQTTANGSNNKNEQKQKGEQQDGHDVKDKSKKDKAHHNNEISQSQNEKKTENGHRNGNEKNQQNGSAEKRAANQKDKDVKDKKQEHGKQQKKHADKPQEQDKKAEKVTAAKEKSDKQEKAESIAKEKADKEAANNEKSGKVAKEPTVVQQKQEKSNDERAAKQEKPTEERVAKQEKSTEERTAKQEKPTEQRAAKQEKPTEEPAAKQVAEDVIIVAPADTAPEPSAETPMVTSTIAELPEEEDQAMDVSISEEMTRPAVCVTPKRPLREKKTPTPTKVSDKLNMSPTVVLTRADKAAAVAAAHAANEAQSQIHVTPTKQKDSDKQDENMESILLEPSPIKSPEQEKRQAELGGKSVPAAAAPGPMSNIANPAATSTPGKPYLKFAAKSELPIGGTPDRNTYARSYNQISGRRSFRPISGEYTPAAFQSNMQFRESYRRVPTDLDGSLASNTSMNVTVGSELTNNSSFASFFSRNRKRDRAPSTQSLNADVQNEVAPQSPPKRARFDGFMTMMASPITMLRARFSKTSLQNSVPQRLASNLEVADDEEVDNVQNLSGADENTPPAALANAAEEHADITAGGENDVTIGKDAANVTDITENTTPVKAAAAGAGDMADVDIIEVAPVPAEQEEMAEEQLLNAENNDIGLSDIQIVETPVASTAPATKQKPGCVIM